MRKLIVSMNVTLDGFMAGPNGELDWHFQNWTDEMAEAQCRQLSHADTILLGANTYRAMAGYWPVVCANLSFPRQDIAFADMMNSYHKVVVSKTITRLTWHNAALMQGTTVRVQVQQLKLQTGKDIMVYGSGKLVSALVCHGLVDEYILWLYPVVLGKGKPLFKPVKERLNMQVKKMHQFQSGVVLMHYAVSG